MQNVCSSLATTRGGHGLNGLVLELVAKIPRINTEGYYTLIMFILIATVIQSETRYCAIPLFAIRNAGWRRH